MKMLQHSILCLLFFISGGILGSAIIMLFNLYKHKDKTLIAFSVVLILLMAGLVAGMIGICQFINEAQLFLAFIFGILSGVADMALISSSATR